MPRLSQQSINRKQFIPQHIQQSIGQHLQSSMPGNLQRYMNGGRPIPVHAQKAITKQMERMPGHLKEYAGAYMEQHVISPSLVRHTSSSNSLASQAPIPNVIRQDHSSNIASEQLEARFHNNLFTSDSPSAAAIPQSQASTSEPFTPPTTGGSPQQNPYDFITEPQKSRRPNILSGASMKQRILVVLGGAVLLIIVVAVIFSLFSNKPASTGLITLAQQQNEMITIATSSSSQANQQVTKNLIASVQLSLITSQNQLLAFLKSDHQKVNSKQLTASSLATATQELTSAQAASNFDPVYVQITQNELTSYASNLKQVFTSATSTNERQLLSKQYQAASLLLTQANSAATGLQGS